MEILFEAVCDVPLLTYWKNGGKYRVVPELLYSTSYQIGKLFGSVGVDEIVLALEAVGVGIEKQVIILEKSFKEVGTYELPADFGHGVKTTFELVIEAA